MIAALRYQEPNFSYRVRNLPRVRVLFPNRVIRADDLARATVDVAVRRTGEPGASFSRTVIPSHGQIASNLCSVISA